MFVYYGLISLSVIMFGGGFLLQDLYRKKRGSSLKISMESAFIGALTGLIVLLLFNGFSLKLTAFTLYMALFAALNGILFTFCTFKALDHINLSLFSLFAMLGGMLLPFFQGILFYKESFTFAKAICVLFVCGALTCTVERGKRGSGRIFYLGIFVLNGMAGVISKLFASAELPKTDVVTYSAWISLATAILSGSSLIVLSVLEKRRGPTAVTKSRAVCKKALFQSYALGSLQGAINRVANYLLVFALLYVDSSVQYPMVTGGTMIVSTAMSFFGEKKPSKRELFGVVLAFLGMCALFFIPF